MKGEIVIAARHISKSFPGVLANQDVSFDVSAGEVHSLLGENGAGKSTLAAILTGLYQPDAGHVELNGARVALKSPRHGLALGIGMVHQHFRLVSQFTVAENISLGDRKQNWILSTKKVEEAVREIGERYGLPVDPRARINELTVGEQQRVEIIKTLYRGAQVLLLDEPTSVLTPQEVTTLFDSVRTLASEGKSVIFISHKLGEVMDISDRVTVMRDGKVVGNTAVADTSREELARMMVGRDVDLSAIRATKPAGAPLLEVRDLTAKSARSHVSNASIVVKAGEIVGIAGVSGNGQRALAEGIAGLTPLIDGQVTICGTNVTSKGSIAARKAGLSYVPEDRNGTGLAPSLSISENMLLTEDLPFLVNHKSAAAKAEEAINAYSIKTPGASTATRMLSGGNVQKVLLARELGHDPQVLIVSSPTWGLDVGAVEFVRSKLNELRSQGRAILLISEDLDEVRALSDRIYVIFEGKIVMECPGEGADVTTLGLAMAGASA
ncbi:MAG: ATP-binding cassette domain-containing protein [Actinobacteria bacterium]|nr:ATP-binding cassette domain-containing protein [Actinomycetota bacterium]MSY28085.1 ATP-binding cassette domain-containing protein [Actinomycetota bacterium]MTB25460.1 ATP-binding cassette domain-containing protein [Actinomycetota bacterium]